jgi:serine/threonine protein kinase/tetratricopeptide (TPR) repeat protein
MGVVYRAERVDGEFDQTVAVKLIKRGMDTDMVLKRFRRERQITAALNHPNIAYFFGGGSTDDGLPYFIMEYIPGKPLYEYCDEHRLNVKERLNLFRQVCYAVAAAHDLQIIHRDLKPSNVLVKDDGKPKLLDFGIAKVLDPEFATDIDPTATQLRVMTPEYASPEQIAGEEVGTTSDIYSLGVILYEVLTGHRPYIFKRRSVDDAARVIREELPTNPSGSLTRNDSILAVDEHTPSIQELLNARNTSLEDLRRDLSGDLDRIVLKTLRKNPLERYQTVADLIDDITNFLEDRPVHAEFFVSIPQIPDVRSSERLSIAILPFRTVGPNSGDTGDEFFGIGLADALITRLSGIQSLVVRPTSSVIPFTEHTAFEAGQHLGVDFALEGTVRVAGSRIRISVQLLNVAENSTRWARAFDEELSGVLQLEEVIAAQVTASLVPHLTTAEQQRLKRRGTNKPAAYAAYMRGRYFWSKFSDVYLPKAVHAFNEAIEIDPEYALPYVGLADFYAWSAIFGEITSVEGFSKARAAIERALTIDPTMGEAYAVWAFCLLLFDLNWRDAEFVVKRAIDLNPNNPFAHECYSNILTTQGRFEEGIAEIRKAEELDPVSPRAMLMTSWTLYNARRYREAQEKAAEALSLHEDLPQALIHLGNTLIALDRTSEAVTSLRRAAEIWRFSGLPRYLLGHARAAEGNLGLARKIVDRLFKINETKHVKPYFIAMAHVAIGDSDKAFEWFHTAFNERNEWMAWFGVEPKLDSVRNDPRYRELLAKTGNPIINSSAVKSDEPPTGSREHSIAVLPFRVIGASQGESNDDEYLRLGLADAVTMRLSNVRRFVVRPTSSVIAFADGTPDPFVAGRELGVEYVVDGLIRRSAGKIRVTAQLLDVRDSATRWSASFADNVSDVLELEDSISEQVTKQLIPRLTGEEEQQISKRGTNNAEAHKAYLRGRYFWNQFTPEAFPKAIEAFEQAALVDPNYAMAYVGLADYYTWACIHGLHCPESGFPKVFEYAKKALSIDPDLAEAHAALGLYYSNVKRWVECEREYRLAIQLNPNYGLAHEWLSALLVGSGRFEEGTNEILTAEDLDPLSLRPKVLSAWTIYQTRNYDLALSKARSLERLNRDFMQTHLQLANILLETGHIDEAARSAAKAIELSPDSSLPLYVYCFAQSAVGNLSGAQIQLSKWENIAKENYVPPYFLGLSALAIGEINKAIDYLQAAVKESSPWVLWLITEPKLDRLRHDERFMKLMEHVGLPSVSFESK